MKHRTYITQFKRRPQNKKNRWNIEQGQQTKHRTYITQFTQRPQNKKDNRWNRTYITQFKRRPQNKKDNRWNIEQRKQTTHRTHITQFTRRPQNKKDNRRNTSQPTANQTPPLRFFSRVGTRSQQKTKNKKQPTAHLRVKNAHDFGFSFPHIIWKTNHLYVGIWNSESQNKPASVSSGRKEKQTRTHLFRTKTHMILKALGEKMTDPVTGVESTTKKQR